MSFFYLKQGPVRGGSIEPLDFLEEAKLNHLIFSIWLTIGNLGTNRFSLNHLIQNSNGAAVKGPILIFFCTFCIQVSRKVGEIFNKKEPSIVDQKIVSLEENGPF